MYWIVNQKNNQDQSYSIVYNYFEIVPVQSYQRPWYNPIMKTVIYPVTYQLAIKAYIATSEDDFLEHYQKTKQL